MKRMQTLFGGNDANRPAAPSTSTGQQPSASPTESSYDQQQQQQLQPPNPVGSSGYAGRPHSGSVSSSLAPPSISAHAINNVSSISYSSAPGGPGSAGFPSPATQYFDYVPATSLRLGSSPLQPHTPGVPLPSGGMLIQPSGIAAPVQYIPPLTTPLPTPLPVAVPAASSPGSGVSNYAAPPDTMAVDRNDLHKSLKSLETLLISLDEYRDLLSKLTKVEKRISKGATELGKAKALREVPSQALLSSGMLFDALYDVSAKHARMVQKEYETLNDASARFFKKVAKEERLHDELVEGLDSKVKKAHAAHEKNAKRSTAGAKAIETHDRYIATVNSLTNEISRAKASHSVSIGAKSHSIALLAASTMGGLADAEFRRHCESVRRAGPSVGRLNEWLNFAASEAMPDTQPSDMAVNELGPATRIAEAEAIVQANLAAQAHAQAQVQAFEQAQQAHAYEQAQAVLRAQQLGWRPPSAQGSHSASTSVALSEIPRLDSGGQVKAAAPIAEEPEESTSQNASPASPRVSLPQSDDVSKNLGSAQTPASPIAAAAHVSAAQPAASHSRASSIADGTVVDRGGPQDRDNSDTTPSLSNGTSAATSHIAGGSSEGAAALPLNEQQDWLNTTRAIEEAPKYEESTEQRKWSQSPVPAGDLVSAVDLKLDSKVDSSSAHDADTIRDRKLSLWEREKERETSLEKERDLARRFDSEDRGAASVAGRERWGSTRDSEFGASVSQRGSGFGPYTSNTYSYNSSAPPAANAATSVLDRSRPRFSDPTNRAGVGIGSNSGFNRFEGAPQLPPLHANDDRSRPAGAREPLPAAEPNRERERYAPAVGGSRLSGVSVNRTLSTDSERSFVAKMRAKYQQEKEATREAYDGRDDRDVYRSSYKADRSDDRPRYSGDYDRPPPRRVSPPPATRRVSDLAQQYSPRRSGYDDAPGPSSSRGGWDDSRSTNGGSGFNTSSPRPPPSEFGSLRDSGGPPTLPARGGSAGRPSSTNGHVDDEAPHSSVCGCQKCSARHYGSGNVSGDRDSPQQYSSTRKAPAKGPPPQSYSSGSAQRRVPDGYGSYKDDDRDGGYRESAARDPRDMQTRRQSLPPPQHPQGAQLRPPSGGYDRDYSGSGGRRSFEDSPQERRVGFAPMTQTIR